MKASVVLVAVAACSGSSSTAPSHLPFIDNEFEVARLEANVRQVPLFVEVWAPW
jgi:hypothetical protein